MFSTSVHQLPHFLEDQFVWLSMAAWAVLLWWLWPRVSRRRRLLWVVLACVLHLTPLSAQLIRATSTAPGLGGDMPVALWVLQAINVVALGLILFIWYLAQRRVTRYRQVQAVLAERRRIANDLHDGVGSRLVALLASRGPRATEPDELSMALQACLLELHMTVDDLDDQSAATIGERLGHLRYRLQPAFDRLGVALVWNIGAVGQTCSLCPDTVMQICRVAQEALSNALRHSQASRVELRFGPQGRMEKLMLEVRDNGRGLDASAGVPPEQLGKGLRSMRARADAMRGELAIMDLAPHGLCVRLLVPCDDVETGRTKAEAESTL